MMASPTELSLDVQCVTGNGGRVVVPDTHTQTMLYETVAGLLKMRPTEFRLVYDDKELTPCRRTLHQAGLRSDTKLLVTVKMGAGRNLEPPVPTANAPIRMRPMSPLAQIAMRYVTPEHERLLRQGEKVIIAVEHNGKLLKLVLFGSPQASTGVPNSVPNAAAIADAMSAQERQARDSQDRKTRNTMMKLLAKMSMN